MGPLFCLFSGEQTLFTEVFRVFFSEPALNALVPFERVFFDNALHMNLLRFGQVIDEILDRFDVPVSR